MLLLPFINKPVEWKYDSDIVDCKLLDNGNAKVCVDILVPLSNI
jgi:hypothetical protein